MGLFQVVVPPGLFIPDGHLRLKLHPDRFRKEPTLRLESWP